MAAGDLKLLVQDPETGILTLGLSRPPQYVSGIDKLVQIVVLELHNNGTRSIFRPGAGGGLRALLGTNVDYDDVSELFSDVQVTLSRVQENIQSAQVNTRRPPSERLSSIQIVVIVPDETNLAVEVYLGVVNEEQAGAQAVVSLV
jgi:hypothetical protein